jgi:L-alanine-DL-glutamate epimerase-like enolase superfamily enzyme
MTNAHVSYSVPNFGIQEYAPNWPPGVREVFSKTPVYEAGYVTIGDAPGLGIDIDERRWLPSTHTYGGCGRRSAGRTIRPGPIED